MSGAGAVACGLMVAAVAVAQSQPPAAPGPDASSVNPGSVIQTAVRGTAAEILRRHADGSGRFTVRGNVLRDTTATACQAFLSRPAAVTVSGHVFGAAVAIFNAGSGQHIPNGIVGTCAIGVAAGTRETVSGSMTGSVQEALEMAVSQVAGVVWLAVEDVDGACALGVYSRDELRRAAQPAGAEESPFCAVQIGKVPR
jgi:hypothetical protein